MMMRLVVVPWSGVVSSVYSVRKLKIRPLCRGGAYLFEGARRASPGGGVGLGPRPRRGPALAPSTRLSGYPVSYGKSHPSGAKHVQPNRIRIAWWRLLER